MRAALLLLILFALPALAHSLDERDDFDTFFSYVLKTVPYWNKDIGREEVFKYCGSTWEGVGHDLPRAKIYYWVCIKERGLRYLDALDRNAGAGYSGAGYHCIYRATHGKSRGWVRNNPFETNKLLANYFFGHYIHGSPRMWHSNPDEDNNDDYEKDISWIAGKCEQLSAERIADTSYLSEDWKN